MVLVLLTAKLSITFEMLLMLETGCISSCLLCTDLERGSWVEMRHVQSLTAEGKLTTVFIFLHHLILQHLKRGERMIEILLTKKEPKVNVSSISDKQSGKCGVGQWWRIWLEAFYRKRWSLELLLIVSE